MGYVEAQTKSGFKVGDRVVITRKASNYEQGWGLNWISAMDKYVGTKGTIIDISIEGVHINSNNYIYPYFVLTFDVFDFIGET